MKKPPHVIDIFLQPGDFYFGEEKTRIRTLLGSCVAITLWHPHYKIGGMCHYMLPKRPTRSTSQSIHHLDGRYAEDAVQLFLQAIQKANSRPEEFQVKLFGGGHMFAVSDKAHSHCNIADANVAFGRIAIQAKNFRIIAEDLGGETHRNVILDLWSGDVWVKKPRERTSAPLDLAKVAR